MSRRGPYATTICWSVQDLWARWSHAREWVYGGRKVSCAICLIWAPKFLHVVHLHLMRGPLRFCWDLQFCPEPPLFDFYREGEPSSPCGVSTVDRLAKGSQKARKF